MDGRQRVGRLRPRPLDWVVGEARPRWGRRADISPPIPAGSRSLQQWLSPFWSPTLRVLEVCDGVPQLADEASLHRALEYYCLSPPGVSAKSEKVGRLGWTCLFGEPAALARCRLKFDLIAWLQEEMDYGEVFSAAEQLLAPGGLLAVTTTKRLDARLSVRWNVTDAVPLSNGKTGIAAQRRSRARAA